MQLLNKIQQKLNVPKNQRNSFGNYNYRSCEDIIEAVKPLLGEGTLTISDDIAMLGDRFYVHATATLTDGKESISVSAYAREPLEKKGMDTAQITGATSSYARKYALNGLFAIDDTKDADTQDNTSVTPKTAPKSVETPKSVPTTLSMREQAENDIKNEDDIFGLNNINGRIQKSTKFSDKDKQELSFIINEKLDTLDPTK